LEVVVVNVRRRTRWQVRRRQQQRQTYQPRRYLLTRNEAAFFRVLVSLVGGRYQISCKVRLADIVTCSDRDWNRGPGNRISQKHLDFVLSCPTSSRIVAAIELDDLSHRRPERRERDLFLDRLCSRMAVPLIRIPACWEYDRDRVSSHFDRAGIPCR
jgi:Protein of unknown function (DUF2726)